MDKVLSKILQKFQDGDAAILVTVIQSAGSTPRGAGAQMAVFPDGASIGTIGGGAVEYESQKLAKQYLVEKKSAIKDFFLNEDEAASLGMICGGDITALFQYLAPSERLSRFLRQVLQLAESGNEMWLVTEIGSGCDWSMATVDGECRILDRYGNFPVQEPGLGLLGPQCAMEIIDSRIVFVQPLKASGHVYIFGGGHISQKLVPFLHAVFFPCTVVDDNAEFANHERFPLAQKIVITAFEHAFDKIQVESSDYIVIVTRGHEFDHRVLSKALDTDAGYIGMIGSRQKNDAIFQKLILEDGFTVAGLRRVNAPIGLPIGGETPEEIALSIAAQLVQVRANS
ncbi:MAG: XdhC family protein [Eubacteriaceae bacterium]|nr:XdhC family protein [Eubacteriaceae bacterium]